jgi:hypothetical protein
MIARLGRAGNSGGLGKCLSSRCRIHGFGHTARAVRFGRKSFWLDQRAHGFLCIYPFAK